MSYDGIIYCVTNKVNGKKYIGMDSKNNPNYLGSGMLIKKSVQKYGKENFKKEILQDCISKADMIESEKYWIDYFNATKSDLFYNISAGGTGGNLGEEVRKIQSESHKKINHPNRFKKGVGSKPYADKIRKSKTGVPVYSRRKSVDQYDLNDSFIKNWNSAIEASEQFGFDRERGGRNITRVCRGDRKSFGGYKWKYAELN